MSIVSNLRKPTVLMTWEMPTSASFDAIFEVHRLWQAGDPDALLRRVGPRVRGITAGGRVRVDAALIDHQPALEVIANFGVGYERVDVDAAMARGILVTNTPDVLTDEVADLAVGLMLAVIRDIPRAERFLREGHWKNARFALSDSLRGRVVDILGLGRIGSAVALRCAAFGVEVMYHSRRPRPDVPWRFLPTPELLARTCNVLIVTTPGGHEMNGLVGAALIEALGPDGILVNVARGSVVDEPALIEALAAGRIRGAGLDVFADEPNVPEALLALDNVVLLPHVGSGSRRTFAAMSDLVRGNLAAVLGGRPALNPVPGMARLPGRPRMAQDTAL